MSLVLPERKVIEAEIVVLNGELAAIEGEARSHKLKPVVLEKISYPNDEFTHLPPTTMPSNFWGHHIGGLLGSTVALINVQESTGESFDEEIASQQGRTHRLITNWREHPIGRNDPLNMETADAFLKSGFSFMWTESFPLTEKLQSCIWGISDLYAMREGHRPISFDAIIAGRRSATRAYLMCSINPQGT
jgi:hypothetical protein